MGKIASFWKILSRDIYVGRRLKNNLITLTIVSIFTTILGSVLVILDLVTKNYSMLVPAGGNSFRWLKLCFGCWGF